LAALRRLRFRWFAAKTSCAVPILIIGNITVGGTGKTPLLIQLCKELTKAGLRPGVISRGYGGKSTHYPLALTDKSDPTEGGDEAVMIARQTGRPVVVDPDRLSAYRHLCENSDCDVVLSDDGLQHYRLPRDLEIVVVDGQRLFGNGFCLPAGPLREPVSRLRRVQHVVITDEPEQQARDPRLQHAVTMYNRPRFLINLVSGEKKPFNGAPFKLGTTVHAVSGIGNPDRFAKLLDKLPYPLQRHDFPDHHGFSETDLASIGEHQPIVMTEKDAVKCRRFAKAIYWYLATETQLPGEFIQQLTGEVRALIAARQEELP
jgi:tetraacyldisaccharide 4'-kinase